MEQQDSDASYWLGAAILVFVFLTGAALGIIAWSLL